ncbi:MAG: DNA mismatch repair protein MutT, partial [Flavobacteriales bacterium]
MKKRGPWTTLSERIAYETPWISVSHHEVIDPGGTHGVYGVIHFKSLAVGVIPLDEEMNTWIVGQYR